MEKNRSFTETCFLQRSLSDEYERIVDEDIHTLPPD
jgi:hypothetical protein